MGTIRVAFLQLTAGTTVGDNLRSGLEACRKARASGADIALLPEVWSHGYAFPDADDDAACFGGTLLAAACALPAPPAAAAGCRGGGGGWFH